MEENYQYPVFFECEKLPDKHKEKIQTYFRVRRKSGGGDCGPVKNEKDRVYSVYFKHQKDQQAVLKKQEHVVKLADGQVVFTVRASLEPPTSDTEAIETTDSAEESAATVQVFKSVQEEFQFRETKASATKRIVLLGKTGSGKSSLANTIFGEDLFTTNHIPNSGAGQCQAETKSVNGRSITLIDTPGFFNVERSEEDLKPEIMHCITECAPGPHAFLIVLKVERFTEQERAVITKICQYFSEDALRYAVIVFTHGDQLPKRVKIEEFVHQSRYLSDLVRKCGGRCHVIDNKYWQNKEQGNYRSNQFQVEGLLTTIDQMVMENNGDFYENKMFQEAEKEIQREEENIRRCEARMQVGQIREAAKVRVSDRLLIQLAGTATGVLIGALFGLAGMVGTVLADMQNAKTLMNVVKMMPSVAAAGGVNVAGVKAAEVVVGAVVGGAVAHNAAEGAQTPMEAVNIAAKAVMDKGKHSKHVLP